MGRRKIPQHAVTPLEPGEDELRAMLESVTERVVRHVVSLDDQPVHATRGGRKLAAMLREPMPERGAPLERLLRLLFGRIIPTSLNTASPGYLAYVPGGGVMAAAAADLIALATNRYAGVWLAAPGLVQIEQNVLDWFAAAIGLPAGSGGLLTSGGSMANLIAIVTARRERLPPDFLRGVVYTSDQAHHSVAKAAIVAGFPEERIRAIPSDERMRLRIDELARAVDGDRAAGLTPFCVVASAGTTNTGAVDDLGAVADLAAREGLWLHVDAAYGGFFVLTERGRAALAGLERADSVTLDPHKGLFLPYGTGCLLVRDREALRRAHARQASYMPPMQTDAEHVDFCELGPELSREARGLRVWLPLKLHGAGAFRDALDEKIDLARRAAEAIARIEGVTLIAPPELSLFAFRLETEEATREVLAFVNARQRVLLTGAVVQGRFVIRVCVLSFRTHGDRIDALIEDVRAAVAAAAGE